jgi:peptidyl-prolyl cis-trans isomerase SurA
MKRTSSLQAGLGVVALLVLATGCATMSSMWQQKPSVESDVVALIEDVPVTVSEFEQRYARTAGGWKMAAQDSMGAYRDFLDRYVNFRLKVRAARDAGYMSDPEVQKEIANYQKNFARPYLIEQDVTRPLARAMYERKQEQVNVSHILLRVGPDALPEDTMQVYRKMQAIVDSVERGVNFGDLALRNSEDPSASRNPDAPGYRGKLGFVPAGRVVKPFEDVAYNTPVGEHSDIFRTKFGYHVLKVNDRRETPSKIRVAHLMLRPSRPGPGPAGGSGSSSPKAKLQQLKDSLDMGASFEALARRHSADRRSAKNGGDLGSYFGPTANLPQPFKDAAFALEEKGDVSDVVKTRAGFHLIKLLGRRENRSFEKAYDDLKKQIKEMPRFKKAKKDLAQRVRREQSASIDSSLVRRALGNVAPDSMYARLVQERYEGGAAATDTVVRIDDTGYTLGAFSDYARQQKRDPKSGLDFVYGLLDSYLNEKALGYATASLAERDEQFGALMREFRDGILLFQLMEDSVWTKAQQDTAALRAYYQDRRDQYRFPERIRAIGLVSRSDSALQAAANRIDMGRSTGSVVRDLKADTTGPVVRVDTVMVTDSTAASPFAGVRQIQEGDYLDVQSYGNRRSVLVVHDGQLEPRPMRFEEAIPKLSSDYQDVLENRLTERLRRRYDVYTYPKHLTSAFKGPKPEDFVEKPAAGAATAAPGGGR